MSDTEDAEVTKQEALKAEEAEEVGEASEVEEAEPVEPVPEATKPPANEMKVVIIMRDDKAMLGVQATDCDPVYTTIEGTLAEALERIPALVAEAKQKWEANPRYPKAIMPEPPPRPTPARTSTTSRPSPPTAQPSFF